VKFKPFSVTAAVVDPVGLLTTLTARAAVVELLELPHPDKTMAPKEIMAVRAVTEIMFVKILRLLSIPRFHLIQYDYTSDSE
jgi:hypothetical protein